MNASSVIAMLQDKLPKNHAQLKTLEDKLNSFDETKINDLVSKIPQLNLKSPTIVFWVRSFIFGALSVKLGKFSLKAQAIQRQTPIHSQLYNEANLAWSAKTSHFSSPRRPFYFHNQCDILRSYK